MKSIWTNQIEELLENSEISNVDLMMIDSVYVSKEYRTKMAEILFEEMKVNSVIFMNSSTLTLFSSGETTYFNFFK
jgi:actin-related protein